jgi:hypothetical protein
MGVLDASQSVLLDRVVIMVMVRAAGMRLSGCGVGRMVVQTPNVHPWYR